MNTPQQQQDPMEYIWERVPKTAEGFIHYLPGDLPYLYINGFVDTLLFTYQEWAGAFDDCKQTDGSYLVSKEKFLSLRPYRYEGPVFEPFDAHKVREGEWTDEHLQKLYDLSIRPSSGIPEEVFWNSIKALKKQGFVQNGCLFVNKAVKTQLAYFVERFPSPRRRLEKEVAKIRSERESQDHETDQDRDASSFLTGKTAGKIRTEEFKDLQSKAPLPSGKTSESPEAGIDIRKLKKPTRKITG